jgi:DNA mismatch endonuclease (patch repair protein)
MDKLDPERRSRNMAAIRSKGMRPEVAVRKLCHALGYRFRLHRRDLPGSPDLVFPKYKAVIFVHGCFWHQHPSEHCADARPPKSNTAYWAPKLSRTIARDRDNVASLTMQGWRVLIVWECETKNVEPLSKRIRAHLQL